MPQKCLYDTVFERMKGDDGEPPAGLEHRLGAAQARRQFAQFVVDEDAQRLKRPGRRIDVLMRAAAAGALTRM